MADGSIAGPCRTLLGVGNGASMQTKLRGDDGGPELAEQGANIPTLKLALPRVKMNKFNQQKPRTITKDLALATSNANGHSPMCAELYTVRDELE